MQQTVSILLETAQHSNLIENAWREALRLVYNDHRIRIQRQQRS